MLLLFLPFNPSQARREFGAVFFIFYSGVPENFNFWGEEEVRQLP